MSGSGRSLADELVAMELDAPIVVALPRGGVPMAREIADRLGAPLEVFGVRRLAHPDMPEIGFGAVAEDGTRVVDPEAAHLVGLEGGELERIAAEERAELRREMDLHRYGRPIPNVRDRTIVVVDDEPVAGGLTDACAARALRRLGAARVILAAPGLSRVTVDYLVDEEVFDALAGPARAAA